MSPATATAESPCAGLSTVHLSLAVPGAKEVVLTGDFTGWVCDEILLSEGPSGRWHGTLLLGPGEYQYRLIVDGCWTDPPDEVPRVRNPYGSWNGVLCVPGPERA